MSHFVSHCTWTGFAMRYFGLYMLPELIITVVVFTMLYTTPLKKYLMGQDLA